MWLMQAAAVTWQLVRRAERSFGMLKLNLLLLRSLGWRFDKQMFWRKRLLCLTEAAMPDVEI